MRVSWPIHFVRTCHVFKSPWDCTKTEGRCVWATLCAFVDAQRCPAGTECPWGLSCSALPFLAPGKSGFLSFIFSLALGRVHLAGSFAHHTPRSTSLPIMASLCHRSLWFLFLITFFHSQFPFLVPLLSLHPLRSFFVLPSWENPQVPHPVLLKGKGSQRVGDIDALRPKLYIGLCWAH